MTTQDWFWVILLGVGWGAVFYFNEVLLRELGPVTISVGRIGVAAIATWAVVLATGRFRALPPAMLAAIAVQGTLMFAAPFTVFTLGQQTITSGAAGIINAMTPIMVVIVSHFWPGGERASWAKSVGVVLGFSGIVFLTVPAMRGEGASSLWGLLFTLLAPVSYGFALNWVRRLKAVDPLLMLAWAFSFATVAMSAVAFPLEGLPGPVGPQTVASVLVLGVVLTAFAFIVFFLLLPRVGATNMSTVTFVAPVSAVFLGVALLGESVDIWKLGGMGAIFLGLLMIDGRVVRRWRAAKDQPSG
ncbi:MAG: DMT family transporter [Paracoccaceae bacterium]|nr:DMT family transporter [Paracoccaceae bacterium]